MTEFSKLGTCSVCGKDAAWNSPCVLVEKGLEKSPLFCDRCSQEDGRFMRAVQQHTRQWAHYVVFRKRGVTFHCTETPAGFKVDAGWMNSSSIPNVYEKTKDMSIEGALNYFARMIISEQYFCTGCGTIIFKSEIAGRPLFAGVNCKHCWEKHLEHAQQERKSGHVCRMCNQPYSFCCC